jgi:hypothetical protein
MRIILGQPFDIDVNLPIFTCFSSIAKGKKQRLWQVTWGFDFIAFV